jgi:hypothetical protein
LLQAQGGVQVEMWLHLFIAADAGGPGRELRPGPTGLEGGSAGRDAGGLIGRNVILSEASLRAPVVILSGASLRAKSKDLNQLKRSL